MRESGTPTMKDDAAVQPESVNGLLACPLCGARLKSGTDRYDCAECGRGYPVKNRIPRFVMGLSADEGQVRRSFDLEHANHLDSRHTHFGPHLVEKWLEDVRLPREYFKGKVVLDAGCGSGRWTYALASLGATVVAVDFTDSGVEITRAATEALGGVSVLQADILRLPFRPESFDFIVSWGVLHHTPDTQAAFARLAPLVKKGGELFVMVYERRNPPKNFCTNIVRRLLQRFPEETRYRLCRRLIIRNPLLYHALRPFILCLRHPDGAGELELSTMQFGLYDWYSPKFNHLHSRREVEGWFRDGRFEKLTLTNPVRHTGAWEVFRYGECDGEIHLRGVRA